MQQILAIQSSSTEIGSPADSQRLIPRQRVPDLKVDTLQGFIWELSSQKPDRFTMIVFYRGFHCPVCSTYLRELDKLHDEFVSGAFRSWLYRPIPANAQMSPGLAGDLNERRSATAFPCGRRGSGGFTFRRAGAKVRPASRNRQYLANPASLSSGPIRPFIGRASPRCLSRGHISAKWCRVSISSKRSTIPREVSCNRVAHAWQTVLRLQSPCLDVFLDLVFQESHDGFDPRSKL